MSHTPTEHFATISPSGTRYRYPFDDMLPGDYIIDYDADTTSPTASGQGKRWTHSRIYTAAYIRTRRERYLLECYTGRIEQDAQGHIIGVRVTKELGWFMRKLDPMFTELGKVAPPHVIRAAQEYYGLKPSSAQMRAYLRDQLYKYHPSSPYREMDHPLL